MPARQDRQDDTRRAGGRRSSACRACPRLVAWREEVGADPPRRYRGEEYWSRPIPGLRRSRGRRRGDRPGAGGARREPDREGVHRRSLGRLALRGDAPGWAGQPADVGVASTTGSTLRGAWVTAAVRCAPPANKPTPDERDRCLPYLERELALLPRARALIALGAFAWDATLRALRGARARDAARRSRASATGRRREVGPYALVGSYHPSQQNTFTGRLTEEMLDRVIVRAGRSAQAPGRPIGPRIRPPRQAGDQTGGREARSAGTGRRCASPPRRGRAGRARSSGGRRRAGLVYQPLVRSGDGRTLGLEALLRWEMPGERDDPAGGVHPDRGALRADDQARAAGCCATACSQLAAWERAGLARELLVHVDLSAPELDGPGPGRGRSARRSARRAWRPIGSAWR